MFATLFNGFGILALVLAVVGLYGVISYSMSRRRGEIGVRLALGARPRDVVSLILSEGLGMGVLGTLLWHTVPVAVWKVPPERTDKHEAAGSDFALPGAWRVLPRDLVRGRFSSAPR